MDCTESSLCWYCQMAGQLPTTYRCMQGDAEGGSAGPVGATSKKDGMVRRRELLGSGQASLAGKLGEACCGKAAELLVSPEVVNVLLEAASGGEAGVCITKWIGAALITWLLYKRPAWSACSTMRGIQGSHAGIHFGDETLHCGVLQGCWQRRPQKACRLCRMQSSARLCRMTQVKVSIFTLVCWWESFPLSCASV